MNNAHEMIDRFGKVEDDQKYTRLVELFTEDAVYYDPFAGAQVGKAAIHEFMTEMERVIPAMGVYFANWETCADTHVGWARWEMVVPVNGVNHPIPGQSLYRLRDGEVCFVADYVDPVAYAKIRPDRRPDALSAASATKQTAEIGSAKDVVTKFWNARLTQWTPDSNLDGVVSINDMAIDNAVAWVQWTLHSGARDIAGWTLHTIADGQATAIDYWDAGVS